MSEGIGQTISCAAHNCEILIDDATVMKLVPDAKVRLKYQHLITNSFVEVIGFIFNVKIKKKLTIMRVSTYYRCSVIGY